MTCNKFEMQRSGSLSEIFVEFSACVQFANIIYRISFKRSHASSALKNQILEYEIHFHIINSSTFNLDELQGTMCYDNACIIINIRVITRNLFNE